MQTDLLSKWLAWYDPIHRGCTPRGIANAVCATGGWCFPRVGGGYNLYRGTPTEADIDFASPVGAAGPAARAVSNFTWRPHAPATAYHYVLKAIGGGGVESAPSAPAQYVAFDGSGAMIGARPHPPLDLSAAPSPGGRFVLGWVYASLGENAEPVEFRVHSDAGTGVIDYDMAIGVVAYARRRFHYQFTTAPHAHGARRRFAVRAVSAQGQHDGNIAGVEAVADAAGPQPQSHLIAECLEV